MYCTDRTDDKFMNQVFFSRNECRRFIPKKVLKMLFHQQVIHLKFLTHPKLINQNLDLLHSHPEFPELFFHFSLFRSYISNGVIYANLLERYTANKWTLMGAKV